MSLSPAGGDVSAVFHEGSMGLLLSGVDDSGRESNTPDSRCAFVVVTGIKRGSQAEQCARFVCCSCCWRTR